MTGFLYLRGEILKMTIGHTHKIDFYDQIKETHVHMITILKIRCVIRSSDNQVDTRFAYLIKYDKSFFPQSVQLSVPTFIH